MSYREEEEEKNLQTGFPKSGSIVRSLTFSKIFSAEVFKVLSETKIKFLKLAKHLRHN